MKVGEKMTNFDRINSVIESGNGYLIVANAIERGISKSAIADYLKKNNLEKAARGIYVTEDTWLDDLYVIQLKNKEVIFSGETALYLHELMEREPIDTTVTVRRSYNAAHLRSFAQTHNFGDVQVHTVSDELFDLGVCDVETHYGNTVHAYDMDRTICEIIKQKDKIDIQIFVYAVKEYFKSPNKNIPNLTKYAEALKVEEAVRTYAEVLL